MSEDIKTKRQMMAILRVLQESEGPLGSTSIAERLAWQGVELSERNIRNYLSEADSLRWTENLGRRGRRLTDYGLRELERALVVDKVGFVSARVDDLAYRMNFDINTGQGSVILNVSTVPLNDGRAALEIMLQVFKAGLGMGRLLALAAPGERIGTYRVPEGFFGFGTICSVSINGILLRANIHTASKFGGLLQMVAEKPRRFSEIINYDGSSLDPLEIFIRGHMTSVAQITQTGSGTLGASFREVTMAALPEVRRLIALSERIGIGGLLAVGSPNQPLLDIPVSRGRVGLVVPGGLNPVAAVVEAGIQARSTAMSTLCEFSNLIEYTQAKRAAGGKGI